MTVGEVIDNLKDILPNLGKNLGVQDVNFDKLSAIRELIVNQLGWLNVNINNLRIEHPNNPPEGSWQKYCSDTKLSCLEGEKAFLEILLDKIA